MAERGASRLLTDWTASAGLDGTGLLALVLGGRTPEALHLATLGYEVFVLHADRAAADAATASTHLHHVAASPADLPDVWRGRFDLLLAWDDPPPVAQVAPSGLVFCISLLPVRADGLIEVAVERTTDPDLGAERLRTVLVATTPAA